MALQTEQQDKVIVIQDKGGSNWLVPTVVVLGIVGAGVGIYFYFKGKSGIAQGSEAKATVKFHYSGPDASYRLQVSLGHDRSILGFDHVEGMTWTKVVSLSGSGDYTFDIPFELAAAAAPGVYDSEFLIGIPGTDWLDYVEGGKLVTKGAITIKES